MDMKELSNILQQNGIVGAGGAGFPTYAKLNENAETLILNCAECEPLLRLHRQLLEKYAQEIDEILKKVIAMGKGIELNTAGWKYGLAFCHPHPEILCRYKELGGEIITVGSDAHKPEHVAYDFQKAADVLKACGFKYYTEFQDRKPIFKQLL